MADLHVHTDAIATVGLIGCGAIGSALDEGRPSSGNSLTHAAAITCNPHMRLVGVADADAERAATCARVRKAEHAFPSAEAFLDAVCPDLLVLAVPPEGRIELVERALARGVRAFFCEKPFAVDATQAQRLQTLLHDSGAVCGVNYFRRWSPLSQLLREQLDRMGGASGLQRVGAVYGKGLANNASHLLDLLAMVIGYPVAGRMSRSPFPEFGPDASPDVLLDYEIEGRRIPCHMASTDYHAHTMLEVDLIHAAGRIRVLDSGRGLEVSGVVPDADYPGYRRLAPEGRWDDCLRGAMDRAYEEWVGVLRGAGSPACTASDGQAVLQILDSLRTAGMSPGLVPLMPSGQVVP
jgi:predicted dehydrogenase